MRREWDMNSHTAHSRFMGLGAVETVSCVWTGRLLAWCHKKSNLLAVPTAPLLRQTDNSFTLGEECHFGKQPAFSQHATRTLFMFKQVWVSSYLGKGQWCLADINQLVSAMAHIARWHHSQLGPLWQRPVSVSVHLCWLSHDVNVTRCCKLTSNMTGPTRRQFQRDRYNTILIGWRIRLRSKRLPLPRG